MSLLVNPFTEKLAVKFAKSTLGTIVQQGKKLYKSVFGMPEALKKKIAHNPYNSTKTSIFSSNNPQGETAEQLLAKLAKKHGYQAVDVGHGMKAYIPKGKPVVPGPPKIPPTKITVAQPIKINPKTGKPEIVKSLTHEPPRHNAGFTGFHNRPAKPSIITPEYVAKAKSFKSQTPVQEARTQAYYDKLGEEIKNGAAFYNPKTGKSVVVAPEGYETITSLWNGKVENPLFKGSMSDVIHSLGDAKEILQVGKYGIVDYRKPNALMPFITKANRTTKQGYEQALKEMMS